MNFCTKIFVFYILFFLCGDIFSVDIGSDAAVSRFEAQQVLNNGDRVAGFAALEGGFKLSNSSTIATFDSFFPVSGQVDLEGGTLILGRDLILRGTCSFQEWGNIDGYGHVLEFTPSVSLVPITGSSTSYKLYDLKVFLNGNILLDDCSITFTGDSLINGRGNILSFGSSCTLIVDSNSSLLIKDIILCNVSGTKIHCIDSLSTISLENVEWIQDNDFTFTVGKFDVLKDFLMVGDGHIFAYQTDQVSTISTFGRMILDNGFTFSYAPPIASQVLVDLYEETSEIVLNGATLHATSTGLRLETGRLVIDRNSILSSDGTVDSEGIWLENDLYIQLLPAANLFAKSGIIVID